MRVRFSFIQLFYYSIFIISTQGNYVQLVFISLCNFLDMLDMMMGAPVAFPAQISGGQEN
jgi:hypothetical protein